MVTPRYSEIALQDKIESLVDRHGLYQVVDALKCICDGKAEHLATNWQDRPAARNWEKAASLFSGVFDRLEKIMGLP